MVTKTNKSGSGDGPTEAAPDFSSAVKGSAQQIWLAGLGAFAKAQEEGSRVFDTLVKEGMSMQRKTQSAAEEKLSEASSRMAAAATDLSSKAAGQWDKLETIFEGRVSKALSKIGIPTASDLDALNARIDELERKLTQVGAKSTTRAAPGKRVQPTVAKRKPASKAV